MNSKNINTFKKHDKLKFRLYEPTIELGEMMKDGNVECEIVYLDSISKNQDKSVTAKIMVLDVSLHDDAAEYYMPVMKKYSARMEQLGGSALNG